MRADRLISILLLLQQRGRMSASALAGEVEVSRRTVMRDLEALGSAGVPIYSVRGPDGGFELWDGFRARLTGLTADEVRALPLWGHRRAAELFGLSAPRTRLAIKVAASLPEEVRHELTVMEHVFLHDADGAGEEDAERIELLATAVSRRRVVTIEGDDGGKSAMYPLALVDWVGTWFVVGDVGGDRLVWRVSDLGGLSVTGRRFHRPDGFDLPAFWRAWRGSRTGP